MLLRTTLGCTGWEWPPEGIWDIPFPTRALQEAPGEGFLGQKGLTCPSSPLKPLPGTGRGLSPSSGSTRDPQGSPRPTPLSFHQVPARPGALNQQEEIPGGFKARARAGPQQLGWGFQVLVQGQLLSASPQGGFPSQDKGLDPAWS